MFLFLPWRQWLKTKTKSRKQKSLCSHCLLHQQTTLVSSLRGLKSPLLPGAQCSSLVLACWHVQQTFLPLLPQLHRHNYLCIYFYLIKMHTACQCGASHAVLCCWGFLHRYFFPFVEKQQMTWNFMWTCKSTFGEWGWGWDRDGGWERNTVISALSIEVGHGQVQ